MVQDNVDQRRRRKSGLAGNIALVLVSVIVALLFMEAILRLMPSLISVPLLAYFPAPLRHEIADRLSLPSINDYVVIESADRADHGPPLYHPAPNSIFITARDPADTALGAVESERRDARGFCNPLENGSRTHVDIVAAGDSFTTCTGIKAEDTSSNQLEHMGSYTAYNIGVGNLGLYEYVELLRHYGLALKPRLVIMNIYEGNDLRDAVRYQTFLENGRDRQADGNALEGRLSMSYAISFLYAVKGWQLAQWRGIEGMRSNYHYAAKSQGVMVPMNVTNADLGEVRDAKRLKDGEIRLDLWAPPLQAFKDLAQANGFIPIVSYTPSMHEAYADTVVFEDEETGRTMKYASAAQREWLAKKTAELGLTYIDLTPAFQEAVKSGPLTHFPANVHLTPYGQQVTATAWKPLIDKLLAK
ncbi:hypothetical protein BH10PSE7_BH10PSE7_28640 [soil metagenome]